ncbi:hypothetical protein HBH03_000527 [Campylobacter jejuni]|nr:hypothetical protein [Campylobacter jejuni]
MKQILLQKLIQELYKVTQSMIKDYYSDKSKTVYYKTVLILTSDGKRARLSTLSCDVATTSSEGYSCESTADHNYSIK